MWVLLGCGLIDCLLTQKVQLGRRTAEAEEERKCASIHLHFGPGSHQEHVKDSAWRSGCHICCSFAHPLLLPRDTFKQLYCFTEKDGDHPKLPSALV